MKKFYSQTYTLFVLLTLTANNLFAQLNGTYTIPGNYSSISAAINALNTLGVSGNTTFLVSSGWREQASNLTLTASGSPGWK